MRERASGGMVVIFDIGSTLIEGPPYGPARRLQQMLELGEDVVRTLEPLLFRTETEQPEQLGELISRELGIDQERTRSACRELWDAQLQEAYVLPGALQTVAALRKAEIPRAYLSNIWPPFYERFRTAFAEEAGAPQVLSFRSGRSKPDPDFFREVLDAAGTNPEDAMMVGDTYVNDILPAIELGMKTAWILHRPKKEQESLRSVRAGEAPRPDIQLNSIGELTPVRVRALFEQATSFPR